MDRLATPFLMYYKRPTPTLAGSCGNPGKLGIYLSRKKTRNENFSGTANRKPLPCNMRMEQHVVVPRMKFVTRYASGNKEKEMRTSIFCLAGTSTMLMSASAFAGVTVIDFQSLEHAGTGTADAGYVYMEDGYTLSHPDTEPFEFATWGTGASNYPGSTALFNNTVGGVTTLQEDGGNAFNLLSMDISVLLDGSGPTVVVFTGEQSDGDIVTDTFTSSGSSIGLETHTFSADFLDVVSVSWEQLAPFHQFDNINVSLVPAPGALALLGVAGLAARRRRRA